MQDDKSNNPFENFLSPSYSKHKLCATEDALIKDFLIKLYHGKYLSEHLTITKILGVHTCCIPVAVKATVNYNEKNDYYFFDDEIVYFSVLFFGQQYEMTFQRIVDRDMYDYSEILYYASNVGITPEANRTRDLMDEIFKESQRLSIYNKKTITFNLIGETIGETANFLSFFNIIQPQPVSMNDLFISEIKKEQMERFIYSVNNFEREGNSLRYLLSGPPGTGKTQLINAVINKLQGKVTTIIVQGGSFPFRKIFEYCAMFDLCLLVVDDIDFIVNDRETSANRKELAVFLQYLDGFIPNNIFLIASTNDKTLVDAAASRPGRFDLIMDISEIDSANYLSLVNRETSDNAIVSLFNDETLRNLKYKKVTGAFIVSLIKQLVILKNMKGSVSVEDFRKYTELTHKGFYSSNSDAYSQAVGF